MSRIKHVAGNCYLISNIVQEGIKYYNIRFVSQSREIDRVAGSSARA